MEQKGIFSVARNALIPMDERARTLMGALKIGDRVLVNVHRPRWIEHHRLAFAVLNKIADAKGVSVDELLTWLKVATGRVDFVAMPNGKKVACPKSISFASMDQGEFQRFWDEAFRLISEHILPGVDLKTFEEVREIVASNKGIAK